MKHKIYIYLSKDGVYSFAHKLARYYREYDIVFCSRADLVTLLRAYRISI